MEIQVPKEYAGKEKLRSLPAKDKEEYITNLIKGILELNPNGVTISQIKNATGLTPSTVWHHLEMLKSSAQCRKISHGNIDIYHHIGKLNRVVEYASGTVKYVVSTVSNQEGDFACIHELRESRGTHKTIRGVAIPYDLLGSIADALGKAQKANKKIKGN